MNTQKLVDLLNSGSLPWVSKCRFMSVYGFPGVGKSTLVTAIGNRLLDRGVPVHYVDLAAVSDTETAVVRVLYSVSAVDDMDRNPRQTLQTYVKSFWWNTVLIIDNCDRILNSSLEKENFSNFLVSLLQQSKVLRIVTTSQTPFFIVYEHTHEERLMPLSKPSATELVMAEASASRRTVNNEQAQRIANLLDGVPLALRIAGKLLHFRLLRAGELIKRLEESPIETLSGDDVSPRVETTLELSFSLLKPERRREFSYLAVLQESFSSRLASAILADTAHGTQNTLHYLTKRCLLEYSERDQRYRMHSLLQAFGKTKLKPETQVSLLGTVDRYLASNLLRIGDYSVGTATRNFEKDRDELTTFIQSLSRNSSEGRNRQYYCLKIATSVYPKLTSQAVPCGQWMRLHESCLNAFEAEPRSYLVRHYVQTAVQLSAMYLYNKSDVYGALDCIRRVEPTVLADPPPFRVTLQYYLQFITLCRIARQGDDNDDCTANSLNRTISFFEPTLRNITNQQSFQRLNSLEFLRKLDAHTVRLKNQQQDLSKLYQALPSEFYLSSVRAKKKAHYVSELPRQGLWQQANSHFAAGLNQDSRQYLDEALQFMRQENVSDWQMADALFHAGYLMTVWNQADNALQYLNESFYLRKGLTTMQANKKRNKREIADVCDIFVCMLDATLHLPGNDSDRNYNVHMVRLLTWYADTTSLSTNCVYPLQVLHFSWMVSGVWQKIITDFEKRTNSLMARVERRQGLTLRKIQKLKSKIYGDRTSIGRQLHAIRVLYVWSEQLVVQGFACPVWSNNHISLEHQKLRLQQHQTIMRQLDELAQMRRKTMRAIRRSQASCAASQNRLQELKATINNYSSVALPHVWASLILHPVPSTFMIIEVDPNISVNRSLALMTTCYVLYNSSMS